MSGQRGGSQRAYLELRAPHLAVSLVLSRRHLPIIFIHHLLSPGSFFGSLVVVEEILEVVVAVGKAPG